MVLPKAMQTTKSLRLTLSFSLLMPMFVACGGSEIVTNKPINSGGLARLKIRAEALSGGFYQITAQPSVQVVGGSVVYCLSDIDSCKKNQSNVIRMLLTDGNYPSAGEPTTALHKAGQPIDSRLAQVVSVAASDYATKSQFWISLRLDGASVQEEKTLEQPTPTNPVAPVNTAIDRFQIDPSALQRASQKLSGVDFDYNYAQNNLHPTAPKLRTMITNQSISALRGNVGVVLGGIALSDSSKYVTSHTAVALDPQGALSLVGENLQPATVYRMRLHFFDRGDRTQTQPRYIGSSSRSYNFVTDAVSDPLAKARVRIVIRGMAEESDWEMNRYDRSKNYTHGAGGWCHVFYNWVIKTHLKTRSGSENTHYSQSYWSNLGAVTNGPALAAMSLKEPIMGDYFRVGSHAAMILAYDVAKKQFATLEGNFNSSVEYYQRSPGSISWIGHINQQMLK